MILFEIDLPIPPSLNSIWRTRRGQNGKPVFYLDGKYKRWRIQADLHAMQSKALKGHKMIDKPFKAIVTFDRPNEQSDLDNRLKPLLDWCEHAHVIKNDKLCHRISAGWGTAPKGCRITLVTHSEEV